MNHRLLLLLFLPIFCALQIMVLVLTASRSEPDLGLATLALVLIAALQLVVLTRWFGRLLTARQGLLWLAEMSADQPADDVLAKCPEVALALNRLQSQVRKQERQRCRTLARLAAEICVPLQQIRLDLVEQRPNRGSVLMAEQRLQQLLKRLEHLQQQAAERLQGNPDHSSQGAGTVELQKTMLMVMEDHCQRLAGIGLLLMDIPLGLRCRAPGRALMDTLSGLLAISLRDSNDSGKLEAHARQVGSQIELTLEDGGNDLDQQQLDALLADHEAVQGLRRLGGELEAVCGGFGVRLVVRLPAALAVVPSPEQALLQQTA